MTNQTLIAARLIQSAAHITAVTKCNDPLGSLDRISDRQFEKIAGVPKHTWKQICADSGDKWMTVFIGQYRRAKTSEDRRLCTMYGLGESAPLS